MAHIGHNRTLPSTNDLLALPLANAGVYVLTEREVITTRTRIYQLNGNHVHGWKWRTAKLSHMEERRTRGGKVKLVPSKDLFTLLVWRVA